MDTNIGQEVRFLRNQSFVNVEVRSYSSGKRICVLCSLSGITMSALLYDQLGRGGGWHFGLSRTAHTLLCSAGKGKDLCNDVIPRTDSERGPELECVVLRTFAQAVARKRDSVPERLFSFQAGPLLLCVMLSVVSVHVCTVTVTTFPGL